MTTLQTTAVQFRSTGLPVGVEALGIDLAQDLDQETFLQIERAFDGNGVLFFRGQALTPERLIAFSRRRGSA